jgi:hypothetical protein
MILAPKHLLLTRMATLGRLSLRRRPLPVAKAGRCVNHTRNAVMMVANNPCFEPK